jgi:hypothetical protein
MHYKLSLLLKSFSQILTTRLVKGAKEYVIPFQNKNNNSGHILHLSLSLSLSLHPSFSLSLSFFLSLSPFLSFSLTSEKGVRLKHARTLSVPHSVSMCDYYINNNLVTTMNIKRGTGISQY